MDCSIRYSSTNCFFSADKRSILKGRSLEYSIEFGILWALVSVTIFAIRRFYNYRKNINCAVCNDLPDNNQDSGGS